MAVNSHLKVKLISDWSLLHVFKYLIGLFLTLLRSKEANGPMLLKAFKFVSVAKNL